MRVDASPALRPRARPALLLALAVSLAASACGILAEDDAPPAPDPSLAPPVTPPPTTTPTDPARPNGGTFTIPGLDGLAIPLPAPQGEYRAPEPPARGSLAPAPPGSYDANGHMTRAFLEQRAETLHQALVTALDAHENTQVRAIPFRVVQADNEPNAAAACTQSREALMMITTGMIELCAGISEAKAYDEVAGADTLETYVTGVVQQVREQRPIAGVDPSLHRAPYNTDAHKLSRQIHLFDQQVAFIVGHELAHHYRGHTSCVDGRTEQEVRRDEMARALAHTVPPMSQPREVESDMWGLVNVLEAGRARQGGTWTEEGAMLNLDFFRRLSDRGGSELLNAFFSTHPPSLVRIPIVRSAAQQWRPGWRPPRMPTPEDLTGGGQGLGLPGLGNLPIDPSQLPFPFPVQRRE